MSKTSTLKEIIGWREWVQLPKLHLKHIKAKIDTGARTSTLHAVNITPYKKGKVERVKFTIHPNQQDDGFEVNCDAEVVDVRTITDSGGKREKRYIINTPIVVGDKKWDIELTLTDRTTMTFRMLIGRTAIKGKYLVNPNKSFLQKEEI